MERVSTWNVFDHDFIPQLNSIARIKPFWVYKNDENLKYFHPKEVKWRLDEEQLIEKTFFIKPYPCFSFVAIDKTGRYISIFGEFGKQQVWKVCEELLNFK